MLLVLGEFTYFGATIKTGKRVCIPMVVDEELLNKLNIRNPSLPETKSKTPNKFANLFRQFLERTNAPVTQAYAFRHLANQLGEKYGIPQEVRARSLGHSVQMNESIYKRRSNIRTTVDILTGHTKQPRSYEECVEGLEQMGIDTNSKDVRFILKFIYRLDD
ncbi:MAG: site-specific recombinase [Kamptonema sp. SIO4C4]|nr:site-specific recombinase [Kamptonema sp. SIO4C4]